LPFTSVLYELGNDFLYVDGACHYWTSQSLPVHDEYHAWRPYREGVLTSTQERQLHDAVRYDEFPSQRCRVEPAVADGGSTFLWDGREMYSCLDWSVPAPWPLRTELYDAATAVTGPMRIQAGRNTIGDRQVVYEWPLDTAIDQYLIEYGATASFRVDDAAAVTALRALRDRAVIDAAAAPGYFSGVIAIGPRERGESYVLSVRDELSFVDADGAWLPQ
jgi:hypothetical protein